MDIKRVAIDAVNETLYDSGSHGLQRSSSKRINEKNAIGNCKRICKGQVPKDLVAKQYGRGIKKKKLKKVVDLALERFIQSERLNLLELAS
jgi:trigger factor